MRIRMNEVLPEAYEIMLSFEKYLGDTELTDTYKELIKIRASQLNGCAYCLNMHSKDALKAGIDGTRIYMLSMWEKVPHFYTKEEQVILKMTEEITLIQNGLSDETYNEAIKLFSEKFVAQVIAAIIVINAWNRIGVATEMGDQCSI